MKESQVQIKAPKINSLWQNPRKNKVYRVWMIATEVDTEERPLFVIFQVEKIPKPSPDETIFSVCHFQDARLGKVCNLPLTPKEWFLHWRYGAQKGSMGWACPLESWYENFKPVTNRKFSEET